MKHVLLSGLLVAALVFSACEKQSSINAPTASKNSVSLSKALVDLNLSNDQASMITDAFYMGSDLALLLDQNQVAVFNSIVGGNSSTLADPPPGPRLYFDMDALMWYRLILKANTDVTDEQKKLAQEAIDASNARRKEIISNTALSAEEKKTKLQEEHDALMTALNGVFGSEQLVKAQELKDQLEQQRKDRQAEMIDRMIQRQVDMWTKALTLTAEQQELLKQILKTQYESMQTLREQYKGDPTGYRTALQKLQKDTDAAIRAILLEAQIIIWDKMHQRGGGEKGGGTGGGTIDAGIKKQVDIWTKQLSLNTDQVAVITKILTDSKAQEKLLAEQYKGDPAGLRAALEKLHADTKAAVRGSLNEEQKLIWDKMNGSTGGGKTDGGVAAQVDYWTKMLSLTPEQANQITAILTEKEKTEKTYAEQYKDDPAGLRSALEKLRLETDASIRALLTIEQQARWDKLHSTTGGRGGVIGG